RTLKEEAANGLLKLLEEPPKQNIFILTAVESQTLLPTVVSRCCHVRFQPLDDASVEHYLTDVCKVASDRARELARLSQGSLERARSLTEGSRIEAWERVRDILGRLETISMLDFFPMVQQWVQQSEDLAQDLEGMKFWIRDIILNRLDTAQRRGEYDSASRIVAVERLFSLFDTIEQAAQHLGQNANKQLTLEGVCLEIKEKLYGKQGSRHSLSQRG
ncbi:MAG: hypothetical protein ACLGPL_07000, partial [Acidobacteriota bacterium]